MDTEELEESLILEFIESRPGFTAGQVVRVCAHSYGMTRQEAANAVSRLLQKQKIVSVDERGFAVLYVQGAEDGE